MFRGLGAASIPRPRLQCRFFSFLTFDLCEGEKVRVLPAEPKIRRQSGVQLAELRARGRTPIVVTGRAPTMRRNPKNIHGSISTRLIMREYTRGEFQSRVFKITCPGKEPINATVGHYYHEGSTNSPMFVKFVEFEPGRRTKVSLPVRVINTMESPAIRKGADFRYGVETIPMYWRGDLRIPRGITLDMEHATPDLNFELAQDAGVLPEGLTMKFPKKIYKLGSLHTTRAYEGLAEEVDPEAAAEAAQAEADKAKAAAAKAAPVKASGKEADKDAKAGEAKVDPKAGAAGGAGAAKKK